MNLAILSNINLDALKRHTANDFNEVYAAGYNQYLQELINEGSVLNKKSFDIVLLHLDGDELLKKQLSGLADLNEIKNELLNLIEPVFSAVRTYLKAHPGSLVVLNTIVLRPLSFINLLERNSKVSFSEIKEFLNHEISMFAAEFTNVLVQDWERIVYTHGYDSLYDRKFWYLGRIKYNDRAFELLSKELGHLIRAYQGQAKKVLVLDLDNTLWGGVIGEDGPNGIQLSEDGIGKAYRDLQGLIRSSKQLGIVLALCSKNNLSDAKEVFEKHPMMVLKLDDFVSTRINWKNKASNLREIAAELGLGLDSFVFIDDNPREREIVKQSLPGVIVPEFPADPVDLSQWFLNDVLAVYFPKVYLSREDGNKTRQYQAKAQREKVNQAMSFDQYIEQLGVKLKLHVNQRQLVGRSAQLTQKTNQFNLTTRRYTQKDIEGFIDDGYYVFNLEYQDKFGDEGIIGVVIAQVNDTDLVIDSFLISCRVIGRNVEFAMLSNIISFLTSQNDKIKQLSAEYIATKKNLVVECFYDTAGFTLVDENTPEGVKKYSSNVGSLLASLNKKISQGGKIKVELLS